jgi:hypothetical protein
VGEAAASLKSVHERGSLGDIADELRRTSDAITVAVDLYHISTSLAEESNRRSHSRTWKGHEMALDWDLFFHADPEQRKIARNLPHFMAAAVALNETRAKLEVRRPPPDQLTWLPLRVRRVERGS